jgi:hypothetical protein
MRHALLISAGSYLITAIYVLNGPGRHLLEPPAVAVPSTANEVVGVNTEG